MIFDRLLAAHPAKAAARRLHASAVAQARCETLYAVMGAPDTVEGRFELLTLHVILLIDRLRADGKDALAQALFDVYLRDLDGALREMGVGDLSVPKKMRRLSEAFYGRVKALDAAWAAPDEALEAVLGRTCLAAVADADPRPLAAYVRAARQALTAQPDLTTEPAWPQT